MSWQCQCGAHNDKAALACEGCGHEPALVSLKPNKPVRPMYREVPDRTYTSEPMTAEVVDLVQRTKAKLGSAATVTVPAEVNFNGTIARCHACLNGNFTHRGRRMCLRCYAAL